MRLFFVRHGETVDNVAQVLGGARDAELTNHGFEQAYRLGEYLRKEGICIRRILSSTKIRAIRSSEQVLKGQRHKFSGFDAVVSSTPLLVEQDFGSLEGESWANNPSEKVLKGVQGCTSDSNRDKNYATFIPKETKQSLQCRADSFLDLHLIPTLRIASNSDKAATMVMSHGIILKYVLRQFAQRLPARSIFMGAAQESNIIELKSLNDLCRWSNTGYIELRFERSIQVCSEYLHSFGGDGREEVIQSGTDMTSSDNQSSAIGDCENLTVDRCDTRPVAKLEDGNRIVRRKPGSGECHFPNSWDTLIETVNGTKHLKSLKRTGGGIGNAKFDKKQKTLGSFLKYE